MASVFGIQCDNVGSNTGQTDCDIEIGRIVGTLAVRRSGGFDLATTNPANIYSLLEAAVKNNDPALRIYPIYPGFDVTATNGEDRVVQTAAGSGDQRTTRDEKIGWMWTSWGSFCLYSSVEPFNKSHNTFDEYLITDQNQLIAIRRNAKMQGVRMGDVFISTYKPAMDDAPPSFNIYMRVARTEEWRKNLIIMVPSTGEQFMDLMGLYDAQPSNYYNTAPLAVAGTMKVGVTAGCGGGEGSTNLVELYETILEDTDNWTVRNAKTKATIMLTSITADATQSYLTFVMPTTSPYVPGDGVELILAGVTVLDTAGMPGYEGKSVIIPNPAA